MLKLVLLFLFSISNSWSHEYLETKTHIDVYNKSNELKLKYGGKNVLIVFDIDNTLLKAKQSLGSDQWFEWEAEAIKTSSANFRTFEDLLKAQVDFFQLSSMALTENFIPQMVQSLKKNGHSIILLTSRSPDLRSVTEREFQRNNLWFADSSIMGGVPHSFIEHPFKNKISFMNGIFMTTGHHKGEALAYLLTKARKHFKAIVFADDHERHTRRVYETFSNLPNIEVVTFRYSKEDEAVTAFKQGSKSHVNAQLQALLQTSKQIFNKHVRINALRFCRKMFKGFKALSRTTLGD
ncbi:MAG: DUF2608 domain-containing protein [Bacteriovoracaceae bacterium]